MSIDFFGVSHVVRNRLGKRIALRDLNMHIDNDQRVAILGLKGTGLEEIVNIICGATIPAFGTVNITSEVSWPIGEDGFVMSDLSLITNLRFMARIYEIDADEYAARISSITDITETHWNTRYSLVSRPLRWQFNFALGVCLPFHIYLFESPECPDRDGRDRYRDILLDLSQRAGLVVCTSKGRAAAELCTEAFVLDDSKITYYEEMDAALEHLDRLQEKAAPEEELPAEARESDEATFGDSFDVI
jgi:ABC-type polysaccharide/polyol phosphate transport system ATPase subunit